jgi:hypothetical protein
MQPTLSEPTRVRAVANCSIYTVLDAPASFRALAARCTTRRHESPGAVIGILFVLFGSVAFAAGARRCTAPCSGPIRDPYFNEGHVDAQEVKSKPVFRLLLWRWRRAGRDDATLALLGRMGQQGTPSAPRRSSSEQPLSAGLQTATRARLRREGLLQQSRRALARGVHPAITTGASLRSSARARRCCAINRRCSSRSTAQRLPKEG